jgi:hypothetical protein
MPRAIAMAIVGAATITLLTFNVADASQGPGVAAGGAGTLIQAVMATLVYGSSAAMLLTAVVLRIARGR